MMVKIFHGFMGCFAMYKMVTAWSSKIFIPNHHTTWCNDPQVILQSLFTGIC